LLYFATKAFANFHLRLQFKCFDPSNNSGVFVRARDPRLRLPAELASRADADKVSGNPAWSAVISGFEVQLDDNARGDVNKDFYGRQPEPSTRFQPGTLSITWADMTIACNSTRQARLWFRASGFNMTSSLRATITK
jgi:hypothetical protein